MSERRLAISAASEWKYDMKKPDNLYQTEHDELFASIRSGKPINNGEYMAKSSLLAIQGRMATYTGQTVTWDQAMNSTEDLTPIRSSSTAVWMLFCSPRRRTSGRSISKPAWPQASMCLQRSQWLLTRPA